MRMRLILQLIIVAGAIICNSASHAQTAVTPDIDRLRQDQFDAMRNNCMPNPAIIRQNAKILMALPLDQQADDKLQAVARDANAYTNLIGKLSERYASERWENYQYNFITTVLNPTQEQYSKVGNKFKTIRNVIYMHMAEKYEIKGDKLQAFLLYNDVYRLEMFGCDSKLSVPTNCLRLAAELAMQRLLNIEGIRPYVRW